ncbi:MAG: hypothetical protein K1X75_17775 [Leptospirales bacterium]|nr:hypothetical protein [Leptospirales bacterium]
MQTNIDRLTLADYLADEQVREQGLDSLLHQISFEVCADLFYGPRSEAVHDEMLSAALGKRCRQMGLHILNAKRFVLDVMNFFVRAGGAVIPEPEDYKPYLDQLIQREFGDIHVADQFLLAQVMHQRLHRDAEIDADEILLDLLERPRFRKLPPARVALVINLYMDYLAEMGALGLE